MRYENLMKHATKKQLWFFVLAGFFANVASAYSGDPYDPYSYDPYKMRSDYVPPPPTLIPVPGTEPAAPPTAKAAPPPPPTTQAAAPAAAPVDNGRTEAAARKMEAAADRLDHAAQINERVASEEISFLNRQLKTPTTRTSRRIGALMSFWGDPFPTTYGISLAYNIYDFLRVNLCMGSNDENQLFKAQTVGAGVKFLMPGWEFTPIVGLNLSLTKSESPAAGSIRGFNSRTALPYTTLGLDWQTPVGLDFTVGYIVALAGNNNGTYFLNAGLFF